MQSNISICVTALLLAYVSRQVYTNLAEERYPDLSCHLGYDPVEGKEDAVHTERLCANRTRIDPNVCMKRCLLVQIGLLNKTSFEMQAPKTFATSLVNFAFEETPEGKWGALELAKKVNSECRPKYEEITKVSFSCKDWEPFYECVDEALKC